MATQTPKINLQKPIPNVETDWAFRLNETIDTLDDAMLTANVSGVGSITVTDDGSGNVTISGEAAGGGGGGSNALVGSDGITVTSGDPTDDIAGFRGEFVNASGTLQADIDTNVTNIATNVSDIADNTTLITTTSGHLQSAIDNVESSDVDSVNAVTGSVLVTGTNGVTSVTSSQTITLSANEAAIDHDALLNFTTTEHFTEGSIDHTAIQNVGDNTHAQVDTHLSALASSGVALSAEIDSDISTHAAIASAHHARYADSEAVTATESARFTMSGTLSAEIDSDITTHAGDSSAHHSRYSDSESVIALELTTSALAASGVATDANVTINATDIAALTTSGVAQDANLVSVSGHLQSEIDAVEAGDVDDVNSVIGSVVIAGAGEVAISTAGQTITVSGTPHPADQDTISNALVGSDGITVTSGSNEDTISGFRTEFINASGTLSSEIDSDISTHAADGSAHHSKYTDAEAIIALEPTTGALAASGVATDAAVADNTTLITTTSGHLQSEIDAVESSDVDSVNAVTGAVLVTGTQNVTTQTAGQTITVTGPDLSSFATSSEVDADVAAVSGTLSSEIDSDIATHAVLPSVHHTKYLDSEAIAATESARFTMSGTLSTEIDSDITTHAAISSAHHAKYTDAEAITALEPTTDALAASGVALGAEIASASGTVSAQITDDIATHTAIATAHHTKYTDAEAVTATESARFTMSGTLSTEIDSDITTHAADGSAHHTKYLDSEAIIALEPTTSALAASGVATDAQVITNRTEFVNASGTLQTQIDGIDSSVTLQEAYDNGDGTIASTSAKPVQTGNLTTTGTVSLRAGSTLTNLAFNFSDDTDTGIFSSTGDRLSFAINGSEVARFDTVGGQKNFLILSAGDASNPALQINDADTGFFRAATDTLSLSVGGSELVRWTQQDSDEDFIIFKDRVGINLGVSTQPSHTLQVVGSGIFEGEIAKEAIYNSKKTFAYNPSTTSTIYTQFLGTFHTEGGPVEIVITEEGASHGASSFFRITRRVARTPIIALQNDGSLVADYKIHYRELGSEDYELFFENNSNTNATITHVAFINYYTSFVSDTVSAENDTDVFQLTVAIATTWDGDTEVGDLSVTGTINIPNVPSGATPSIGRGTAGFQFATNSKINFIHNGVAEGFASSTFLVHQRIQAQQSSVASPSFGLAADDDTGLHLPTGNLLSLVAGATERLTVSGVGDSTDGIGVDGNLTVIGDIVASGSLFSKASTATNDVAIGLNSQQGFSMRDNGVIHVIILGAVKGFFNQTSAVYGRHLVSRTSSASEPSFSHLDDADTGMYFPTGDDVLAFTAGGTKRVTISGVNDSTDGVGVDGNLTVTGTIEGDIGTFATGLTVSGISVRLTDSVGIENVVEDLTPQLGGDLDVNGKSITSAGDADVEIQPAGTGGIGLFTGKVNLNPGNQEIRLTTSGGGRILIDTTSNSNTGDIFIQAGGDLLVQTDNSGLLQIDSDGFLDITAENRVKIVSSTQDIRLEAAVEVSSTAPLRFDASSDAASPAYSFLGDTGIGMYRIASNRLGLSAGGTETLTVSGVNDSTDGVGVEGNLTVTGTVAADTLSTINAVNVGTDLVGGTGKTFFGTDGGDFSFPGVTWVDDTDTGIWKQGPNFFTFVTGGSSIMEIRSSFIFSRKVHFFKSGSAAAPLLAFLSDSTTGLFQNSAGDGSLAFATVGTRAGYFDNAQTFHVTDDIRAEGTISGTSGILETLTLSNLPTSSGALNPGELWVDVAADHTLKVTP